MSGGSLAHPEQMRPIILRPAPAQTPPAPESRRQTSARMTVMIAVFVSTCAVVSSAWALHFNQDSRLFLTTTDTFHDWKGLRDVFDTAYNYSRALNTPNLSSVAFEVNPDGFAQVEDLHNRRLIPDSDFTMLKTAWPVMEKAMIDADRPLLLRRLMRISWCSLGSTALRGTTPATRTPGCSCIAQAYAGFLNETLDAMVPQNASLIVAQPSVRDKYADKVVRCFDQRQVSRSKTCGRMCSVHAIALVLYANSVFLLACLGYLLFSEHALLGGFGVFTQLTLLKISVVVLGGVLCIPFLLSDMDANVLNITGIALSVVYLTISLHDELNFPGMDARKEYSGRRFVGGQGGPPRPHPLTVVLLMHLQLILPAYGVLIGVAGYGRDIWAALSFAVTLGLMAMAMQVYPPTSMCLSPLSPRYDMPFSVRQRFFWSFWCCERDDSVVNQSVLTGVFVSLWILLILLFTAYYYDDSLYSALGSVWVFAVLAGYLLGMLMLLVGDRISITASAEAEGRGFFLSVYQEIMFLLTLGLNVLMCVMALVDVLQHRPSYPA